MNEILNREKVDSVIDIACLAGNAIMDIYDSEFDYELKDDNSPLTKADKISNNIILKSLKDITPEIPILSEESSEIPFEERSSWRSYWLVDPLDGTKEFIKKNGEFTVNIALIKDNEPVFGVIDVPAQNQTYFGTKKFGSFIREHDKGIRKIRVSDGMRKPIRVAISRSHLSQETIEMLKAYKDYKTISQGSSLKFCLVASGNAEMYPRLGPTSEWDTAAGHAIVEFAGGVVETLDGKSLRYNTKKSLLNPEFLVCCKHDLSKEIISKL